MEEGAKALSDIPAINRFLSYCRIRTVPSKTVIIHAGDLPDILYYIISGSVEVMIEDEDGNQLDILRDNMPFGRPGAGEFGTYFIGYARSPSRTIRMLRNMFIGVPAGNYDRILDVSTPVTGTLFFVPPMAMLEDAGAEAAPADIQSNVTAGPAASLGIGSLKGN